MTFYRRNLPHWQPAGATYFITFSLADSLPKKALENLKQEQFILLNKFSQSSTEEQDKLRAIINRKIFKKYEHLIDNGTYGPLWLSKPDIAKILKEALNHRDKSKYDLYAYCIMPNHVHLVFRHLSNDLQQKEGEYPITKILESLKKYTARLCNKKLNRTGHSFWHSESFDRVIRDSEELTRTIHYTLNNPVKAGITKNWDDWPNSYCKQNFRELFD